MIIITLQNFGVLHMTFCRSDGGWAQDSAVHAGSHEVHPQGTDPQDLKLRFTHDTWLVV